MAMGLIAGEVPMHPKPQFLQKKQITRHLMGTSKAFMGPSSLVPSVCHWNKTSLTSVKYLVSS